MNKGILSIEQEVRNHIFKTSQEWKDHLSGKKRNFLLELALQISETEAKFKKILVWMNEALGDEMLDDDQESALERYKQLYNNWNEKGDEKQKDYDGSLDFGGSLLTLKELLEVWENPPKPALTPEQQQKLDNYDKLEKKVSEFNEQNEKLRNRELSDNERRVIVSFRDEIPQSGLNARLTTAKRMLKSLKSNDLSVKANPNLSAQGISFPEKLASSFEQIVWICNFYFQMEKKLNQTIEDLESQVQELENE